MADFLGEYPELQPAGEEFWGLRPTLESWEEEEEVVGHNRQSPVRRFSPLVERSEDEELTFSSSPVNVLEEYNGDDLLYTTVPDPIRLRGVGGTTMFGLNNHFQDEFPSHLVGKVAPEEFHSTMDYINSVLSKSIPFNLKCLICGSLCCCCTLGISLGPVIYLSKRTQSRIEKFIGQENWRLYNKLGLNIKLHKEQCDGSNLREYVILFEFLPKVPLYKPD